jgi:uncharacterized protein (DUF302 family)
MQTAIMKLKAKAKARGAWLAVLLNTNHAYLAKLEILKACNPELTTQTMKKQGR